MVLAFEKWTSARVFQDVSVVHGCIAIGDLDVTPAFELCKHHEEVGGCRCARTRNRNGPGAPVSSGSARRGLREELL